MNKTILIQQAYPGYGFEPMLELTRGWHQEYCDNWNIDYQCVLDNPIPERSPLIGSWAKIYLIQQAMLKNYRSIIWLDADTLILDRERNLIDATQNSHIGACWHRIPQLHHWNVGALYINNQENTRQFIDEWAAVYPPPNDGWNEQGVFNRLARQSRTVVTVSDKWNATINVSMVPDAVVMGFHGHGDAKRRYLAMKQTLETIQPVQIESQVLIDGG